MRPAQRLGQGPQDESEEGAADRQTASLGGLAFMLALVVVGLVLVHHLRHEAKIEDCLMAGRLDCSAVVAGPQ